MNNNFKTTNTEQHNTTKNNKTHLNIYTTTYIKQQRNRTNHKTQWNRQKIINWQAQKTIMKPNNNERTMEETHHRTMTSDENNDNMKHKTNETQWN